MHGIVKKSNVDAALFLKDMYKNRSKIVNFISHFIYTL